MTEGTKVKVVNDLAGKLDMQGVYTIDCAIPEYDVYFLKGDIYKVEFRSADLIPIK